MPLSFSMAASKPSAKATASMIWIIFTVGFAAETHDVIASARGKMERKQLDMIVANDVSNQETGFNSDENEVTVIWAGGEENLQRASKLTIAGQIMALIASATTKT